MHYAMLLVSLAVGWVLGYVLGVRGEGLRGNEQTPLVLTGRSNKKKSRGYDSKK
jgi:hypothetical protein